ncbi:MAG: YihA family ribosome biogenesis GTP-binding protein [Bacteroidetes bacterium]|nr:MAG: YihA family ribosome biogenesis GTP-binding protein [Bacteroidota bacterium]
MEIKTARFISSYTELSKLPSDQKVELAFIGRSNVGKSSLINMLCNEKKLAKTSSQPGKTQTINHFLINDFWYLVDLPGYGYAKVSKDKREKWGSMIRNYLVKRETLYSVFVLVDSRLEPQKIDLEFINWLGEKEIPFSIVFTKCDKLGKNALAQNLKKYQKKLSEVWVELPPMFQTSSETQQGKEDLLSYFAEILQLES